MSSKIISPELISRFAEIVGPANALTRAEDQAPYLREWRDRYTGKTPVVLRPGTTDEVSRILALANDEAVGVVPQGGNTGLVGGQIPSPEGNQIVLSLARLKKVRDIDAPGGTMIVEAGVTLAEAQAAAEGAGRLFPLSLASEGSAMIGGALATNAGGTAVLAYGNARNLALGLEAVLADGRVWHGLRRLKKDNTGYDLRDLLIGSEGTLGVITAASLKLFPIPAERETAIVALESPAAALRLFRIAEADAGSSLTAFELWAHRAQEFALRYMPNTRDPFIDAHPWYVLIELSHGGTGTQTANALESLLMVGHAQGLVRDAALARSLQQAQDFWRLRETFSEAQKGAGGSIKHDISVPIARIPEFLARAAEVVERIAPGARPVPFGHFGDGNLHYNVSQPEGADKAQFLSLWEPMSDAIFELVSELGGSISAEHGIGQMKRDALRLYKSPVELDMMRAIKQALDPKGILNPGKLL
ncbi:FAD linked oxidase [Hyphomicrobium denitrificans 1NES1]|uniref:FAD linked oxidase n=1 Tax=Hyphomicrobium denitrificans 1NES1 TaxID=670307 RepID=N0B951_9HYPH|nr:FAD-binding oxidoreductase [Hyphomicrobium denitrificans]AGK59558.1 FAD linked oxidase [Hyphomicrobium denitrificans 1NES1]